MATANVLGKIAPFDFERFTGGHATEWTEVTFDPWVTKVGVQNLGSGILYVSARKTGAWGVTDDMAEVPAGQTLDFYPRSLHKLSVKGADGSGHVTGFILETA